jgi:uncharacterized lipoprotein YddW (UPF0748 family)
MFSASGPPWRARVLSILLLGMGLMMSPKANAAGYADAIARAGGFQGRIMWCDAEANLQYLSAREGVAEVVRRCKDAGINTIVVDVKPLSGYALYNSKIAPHMSDCKGHAYPKNYDLLAVMVDEGHRLGLKVHAAVNVFAEGSMTVSAGTAFDHPDWQCVNYQAEYLVQSRSGETFPLSGSDVPIAHDKLYSYVKDCPDVLADTSVVRALLDSNGFVTLVLSVGQIYGGPAPAGGRVLAGDLAAGDWLDAYAILGDRLSVEARPEFVPVSKAADQHLAVFVNPADRAVKDYELSVIREIVSNYDVDGIVLDRMRYPNIRADFSDLSRREFEAFLGQPVERWPEDVYRISPSGGDIEHGKYFKEWLEWRAHQIHDFLSEVRTTVKGVKPTASLGVYVGSWYSEYYDVGVNWGSPRYRPTYDWATATYNTTGYADLVDYMCTGCYYPYATRADARDAGKPEWATVEAAAQGSNDVVMDDTFIYPSLYLLDYQKKPDAFVKAMRSAMGSGQGIMLFDLVYVRNYDWWSLLKQAFAGPSEAPHDVPGLLGKVREQRQLGEQSSIQPQK